ncbi:hypothetical protein [Agrococcus casei]|uniref:hypothetical protein n=1 Tax=Agrococcus casei TaxID=343512 RepID=UPI003F8F10FE
MRWRALATVGVMAAIAVSAIGCAGEEPTEPSASMELPTPPPSEAPAVLDLKTMTDEELLAEADRSYRGFLDDVREMRAAGSSDYMTLTEWATEGFSEQFYTTYTETLPSGTHIEGTQEIVDIALTSKNDWKREQVRVSVCIDNTSLELVTDSGEVLDTSNGPDTSDGVLVLEMAPDGTKLLISRELASTTASEALCAR